LNQIDNDIENHSRLFYRVIISFAAQSFNMRGTIIIFAGIVWFAFAGGIQTAPRNMLLYNAQELVHHINHDNTDYRHKDEQVNWGDHNMPWQSYADCSGFINALIKKTYDSTLSFKSWLGKSRPLAIQYYQAVTSENHFIHIERISDIQPGDLLVIKYADESDHDDNTGHCMLVEEKPYSIEPVSMLKQGYLQYGIRVIDSSKSPHGKEDSRHSADGNPYAGLGEGVFRLYADAQGKVTGYSWSLGKPLPGFDPFDNSIVVGRMHL
jgi:hypothetical protein